MAIFPVLTIKYREEPFDLVQEEEVTKRQIIKKKSAVKKIAEFTYYKTKNLFNALLGVFTGKKSKIEEAQQEYEEVEERRKVEKRVPVSEEKAILEIKTAVKYFVSVHRQNLTARRYPPKPASRPGEFHKTRTGTLAKSITYMQKKDKKEIWVGYKSINGPTGDPVDYSQILYDRGRKSIGDTMKELQPLNTQSGYLLEWKYDGEYK